MLIVDVCKGACNAVITNGLQEEGECVEEAKKGECCQKCVPNNEGSFQIERFSITHHVFNGKDGDEVESDGLEQKSFVIRQPLFSSLVVIVVKENLEIRHV